MKRLVMLQRCVGLFMRHWKLPVCGGGVHKMCSCNMDALFYLCVFHIYQFPCLINTGWL